MENEKRVIEVYLKDGFLVDIISEPDIDTVLDAIKGHTTPSSLVLYRGDEKVNGEYLEIISSLQVRLDMLRTQFFHKDQVLVYKKIVEHCDLDENKSMFVFKYYRPNIYFEKAIRYNEFYFSENQELNDPNDLRGVYYFEDSPALWRKLLSLEASSEMWDISRYISLDNEQMINGLNDLFKGVEVDSLVGSVRNKILSKKNEISKLIETEFIDASNSNDSCSLKTKEGWIEICIFIIIELVSRAISLNLYSVSFSKSALEPMMWAHYADGFKGCVVMYNILDEPTVKLRQHLMSDRTSDYLLKEVEYIDTAKKIPILECAVKDNKKITEAFLQKNSFWSYEQELRMFTGEELKTTLMTITDKQIRNPRQRVLHHDTNLIAGIIFGPRVTEDYQRFIEMTIANNREHEGKKPFYSFNTMIDSLGQLEISVASEIINSSLFKKEYRGAEKDKLLIECGIIT